MIEPAATNSSRRTARSSGSAGSRATRAARRRRALDEDAAGGDRGERAEVAPPLARLPRARPDVLLGDVEDVHRQDLQALRLPDIADAAGSDAAAAIRSSRPSTSSRRTRRSSSSPTRSAAGRLGDGRSAAGLEHDLRGAAPPRGAANDDVASRWGPRIVQFARTVARIAKQKLSGRDGRRRWRRRPAWRRGASASARASSRSPSSSRRSPSGSRSGRSQIGVGAILRSALSYFRSSTSTSRSAVDHAVIWQLRRRGSCSPRSSAGCSRSRARPIRACSGTRCATRTSSVSPAAPGLGATLAIVYASPPRPTWAVPLAAFGGAIAAVVVTYAIGRSVGATHMTGALVLRA